MLLCVSVITFAVIVLSINLLYVYNFVFASTRNQYKPQEFPRNTDKLSEKFRKVTKKEISSTSKISSYGLQIY